MYTLLVLSKATAGSLKKSGLGFAFRKTEQEDGDYGEIHAIFGNSRNRVQQGTKSGLLANHVCESHGGVVSNQ